MRLVRHWKEVFDPSNEFIFLRRMKLGVAGHEYVNGGDPVTDEIRAVLGEHRLKVWWTARAIGSRDYAVSIGIVPASKVSPKVRPTGRGWFEVTLPDGSLRKVRGREAAEQLLQVT